MRLQYIVLFAVDLAPQRLFSLERIKTSREVRSCLNSLDLRYSSDIFDIPTLAISVCPLASNIARTLLQNEDLNQYWYSPATIEAIAGACDTTSRKHHATAQVARVGWVVETRGRSQYMSNARRYDDDDGDNSKSLVVAGSREDAKQR